MKIAAVQLSEFDARGYPFPSSCFFADELRAHRDVTPIEPVPDGALLEFIRARRSPA